MSRNNLEVGYGLGPHAAGGARAPENKPWNLIRIEPAEGSDGQ